jgi:hypothetical protein
MPSTYSQIATQTLGSTTATVTFSNIPQTYTNLRLVMSAAIPSGSDAFSFWQANGDTATNYSQTNLYGTGSTAGSDRITSISNPSFNYYSNITTTVGQNATVATWFNYSNTTTYKTMLVRSNTATGPSFPGVSGTSALWRSTAAITSLSFKVQGNSFATGSTFTLYGIKGA